MGMKHVLTQAGRSLNIEPAILAEWERRGDIRVRAITDGWLLTVNRMESRASSAVAAAKAGSEPRGAKPH